MDIRPVRDAREALSRRTRVCAYDRTGIGWSDPGPAAIPVSVLAADLGAVLNALEPRRPAILVAPSAYANTPAPRWQPRGVPARGALLPPTMASWFDMGSSAAALPARHQRLAQGSDYGVWKVVPGSDHLIASSRPQAVVEAVTEMIVGGYDRSP